MKGEKRKYYRFRDTNFYGGIATADCVGCNLNCHFCWSNKPRKQPSQIGEFYNPKKVAERLIDIAKENDYRKVRVSGNEPTISKNHLISLVEHLEETDFMFILETNGILLGNDPKYVDELKNFENIHVRVSLKGYDKKQFSKLTDGSPKGFELQIKALKNLIDMNISCNPAVLKDFATKEKLTKIRKKLRNIDISLMRNLEFEKLKLYPHVKKQLQKADIEI